MYTTRIFLACADEDKAFAEDLVRQFSGMIRGGYIQCFYRHQVKSGHDWKAQVKQDLYAADLILFLVSSHFNASDYCYHEEVMPAMERQKSGKVRVIPVILQPVEWEQLIFGELKSLPVGEAVSMWSNKEEALASVVKGVREVIDDLKIVAREAMQRIDRPASYWNVPYWRNPFFTGREAVLANLQKAFQPAQGLPLIQALSGLGGVGKTQIAVEYAYRYANVYRAVLWVRADSADALQSSFVDLAETLDLSETHEANQNIIIRAVKQWLHHNSRWLLIVDNLEDVALLRDMVASPHPGHILVTTRARRTGHIAHRVDLSPLSLNESTLLLLRRTNIISPGAPLNAASKFYSSQARAIAEQVDGLPLALDQAGAYIEETGRGLADYVGLYQKYAFSLLQRRGAAELDHPASVATTFSLSLARIRERNAASVELLELCAFLQPDAIPEDMLVEGAPVLDPTLRTVVTNPMEFDRAIEDLLKFSLIQRDPTRNILLVHRLVQIVIKGEMSEEQQQAFIERVVCIVAAAFPMPEIVNWELCQRYLPQAQMCAKVILSNNMLLPEAVQLLYHVGCYLSERGLYNEAEQLLGQAISLNEDLPEANAARLIALLNALANASYKKGKYAQAELLSLRALALGEQVVGEGDTGVAESLDNLARSYRRQGRFAESEPPMQRALEIRRQVYGSQHPSVAASLNGLANLYNGEGKYTQAERLYRESFTIWQQILGSHHPKVALSLNNMAVLFSRQGKYGQAEPLAEQAQAIYEDVLGPEHPDVATTLDTLTVVYQEQGKYAQAERLYQRLFALYDSHLGREHPQIVVCYNNQARLYLLQGRYSEAESIASKTLALGEKVLGPSHHRVGTSATILADIYKAQQRYAEAEMFYQRALTIREQALGPDDLNIAQTLEGYAEALQLMGRQEEAERLQQRARTIRSKYALD